MFKGVICITILSSISMNIKFVLPRSAINESGLVYDGGLVVSPTFETNDPRISGAGTCVRYSRRLYANQSMHRYHCSEDIGEAVIFLHHDRITDRFLFIL